MTIEEIRWARLEQLEREFGSQVALLRKLNEGEEKPISQAQISQWKNRTPNGSGKPRHPNSESARLIERKCGKPRGWLDTLSPDEDAESGPASAPSGPAGHHLVDSLRIVRSFVVSLADIFREPARTAIAELLRGNGTPEDCATNLERMHAASAVMAAEPPLPAETNSFAGAPGKAKQTTE